LPLHRADDLSPLNAFLPGEIHLLQSPKTRGTTIESDGADLTDERPVCFLDSGPNRKSKGRYQNPGNQPDPDHPNNPQANLFVVAWRDALA
jgi:hypothetical protein